MNLNESWKEIKKIMKKIAMELINISNQNYSHINLNLILPLVDIKHKVYIDKNINKTVQLIPVNKGFLLQIKKGLNEKYERYIISHEIGHTLFYEIINDKPSKILKYKMKKEIYKKEEWLCNDFSKELLIPDHLINPFLKKNQELYPNNVIKYSDLFKSPITLIPKKILYDLDKYPNNVIVIIETMDEGNIIKKLNVYKGKNLKFINIKGKNGILTTNITNISKLITKSYLEGQIDDKIIEYKRNQYNVNLTRYSIKPEIIIGVIKRY